MSEWWLRYKWGFRQPATDRALDISSARAIAGFTEVRSSSVSNFAC